MQFGSQCLCECHFKKIKKEYAEVFFNVLPHPFTLIIIILDFFRKQRETLHAQAICILELLKEGTTNKDTITILTSTSQNQNLPPTTIKGEAIDSDPVEITSNLSQI